MRIHVIIDPKGKVDSKLPEDLMKRDGIRCAVVDLNDGFTVSEYNMALTKLIDMLMLNASSND